MFQRVQFEDWQAIITVVAFILCFLTFLYFCWRALRMPKETNSQMANLPLEPDQNTALSSDERAHQK